MRLRSKSSNKPQQQEMKSLKDRGRLIKGAFRRVVKDEPVDLEIGPDKPEPHDPANDIIDDPDNDDDVVDDVPIPYPPHAMMPQKSRLSVGARDLLSGREIIMLCDSYSDDVSSFNDSVYLESFNRTSNKGLVGGDPEAFKSAASNSDENLLLSDAASFARNAPARVKSLLVADGPKSDDGSNADKPIALLGCHSMDAVSVEDEDELSLSSRIMKVKLDEIKNKYKHMDTDEIGSHREATEVLSSSSFGNSHAKEGKEKRQIHEGLVKRKPRWFRVAVITSFVLLVGAIFLVVVATLKSRSPADEARVNTSSDTSEKTPPMEFGSTESESAPTRLQGPDATSPAEVAAPKESPSSAVPPVNAPTTQSISAHVTEAPSRRAVSSKPTRAPTSFPTNAPTIAIKPPTMKPVTATMKPVTASPTVTHSETPTIEPTTRAPTASPTIDTVHKMVIYLTAGSIDESVSLTRFPTRKMTSFLVHLGDWNQEDKCDKEEYAGVTEMFANSSIPVFFVMGDEESSRCRDADKALEQWRDNFAHFESQHWGQLPWTVFRQGDISDTYSAFDENFMFSYAGAVFMSINLLMTEANTADANIVENLHLRIAGNLEWIDIAYNEFRQNKDVKTIFLFSHDAPNEANELFFSELYYKLENDYREMNFILVHHSESGSSGIEERYMGFQNLSVLGVQGTVWPPLRMTVEFEGARPIITLDQNWELGQERS